MLRQHVGRNNKQIMPRWAAVVLSLRLHAKSDYAINYLTAAFTSPPTKYGRRQLVTNAGNGHEPSFIAVKYARVELLLWKRGR